jgi:hypothetical protein
MPLHIYSSVHASGSVPKDWVPASDGTFKYPVRNAALRRYLQQLLPGRWRKVIKRGNIGEVHYFEHASGKVAGVKYFPY